MEIGVIFATLLLLIILFFIVRLILGPLKIITQFFINCGLALLMLVIINFVGGFFGMHLPVNPISVMGIGILGIPGFFLISFLSFLLI